MLAMSMSWENMGVVAVLTVSTVVEEAGEAVSATSRLCKGALSTTIEDVKLGEKVHTKLRGKRVVMGPSPLPPASESTKKGRCYGGNVLKN